MAGACAGAPGALLIHGFMGTPAEMRPLGEALAAAGYTARAILLPGFGPDVPNLGQMTKGDWLGAASAAWEEMRAVHSPAMLLGFSMGAAIALHLVAARPLAAPPPDQPTLRRAPAEPVISKSGLSSRGGTRKRSPTSPRRSS